VHGSMSAQPTVATPCPGSVCRSATPQVARWPRHSPASSTPRDRGRSSPLASASLSPRSETFEAVCGADAVRLREDIPRRALRGSQRPRGGSRATGPPTRKRAQEPPPCSVRRTHRAGPRQALCAWHGHHPKQVPGVMDLASLPTGSLEIMDTTILARFQCAISVTMMASAASLRIGRAAHFPWWLAELQHGARAPRASHLSAMQLGLRDLPAKTFRVPRQGAKPTRAHCRAFIGPPSDTGVEASGQRRCQGSLKPPREIPVYKFLDL
jgi:hypothetical protein